MRFKMKIEKLLKRQKIVKFIGNFNKIEIEHLSCDTNKMQKNTLYFCLKGEMNDGHNFAFLAKQKGAVALVVEHPVDVDLPQIVVPDSRSAMSLIAGNFFDNPAQKLKLIAVTGTNGKTTTTYMIKSILEKAGFKVGLIGTIGTVIDDILLPATLTTPDPIELHSLFHQMVNKGVSFAVMEASAHAIKLHKLDGIKFDVGILTNITQDHLDFFKTFESYKNTKLAFLNQKYCKNIVINADDKSGQELLLSTKDKSNVFSFGLNNPSDVFAVNYEFKIDGTEYFLNLFDEMLHIKTKMIGQFNLYNALSAVTACKILKIKTPYILSGLNEMQSVAGRFNVINFDNKTSAVIDYAHTPDGLKNILTSVREVTSGKIISIFGCGGNRDTGKREIMGKISGSLADFTIITSDNPRLEKPMDIILQIENGVKLSSKNYLCIENRVDAINYGLKMLKEGDVCVISGKGAENYLDVGGVKYPYSDLETVLSEYQKLKKEKNIFND